MPSDLSGTPTSLGIGTYNTSEDAPSGLGFNEAMAQIDALIASRMSSPAGVVAGEVPVWNGSAWVRSSATHIGYTSLGSGGDGSGTHVLKDNGTWGAAGVTQELAYNEFTASVNTTGTSEATASVVVTASSVVYDGSPVMIEFFSEYVSGGSNGQTVILHDDTAGASLGWIAQFDANRGRATLLRRRITPAAGARVYSIRAFTSGGVPGAAAGVGGTGVAVPGYIRISKAS